MNKFSYCLISITILGAAGTAIASAPLIGTYDGTVEKSQKSPLKGGDACLVTVTHSDTIHAYNFMIDKVKPVMVEDKEINNGINSRHEVKISNSTPGKGVEVVLFKHKDGVLVQLKILHRRFGDESYVVCSSLIKR